MTDFERMVLVYMDHQSRVLEIIARASVLYRGVSVEDHNAVQTYGIRKALERNLNRAQGLPLDTEP